MGRRGVEKGSKGAPAWMTTFGDLMALLLTFFVLMLSLSNVNQQKYEAISEVMGESFGLQILKHKQNAGKPDEQPNLIEPPIKLEPLQFREPLRVDTRIQEDLKRELDSGLLDMAVGDGRLTVSFPEHLAFAAGSAEMTEHFRLMLHKLALILGNVTGEIQVSGHTDDIPISNEQFKSNWELSSARAVAVVQALIDTGLVQAQHLSAVAYADTRPVVPNKNPALRAKNRRVEIKLTLPAN